MLLCNKIAIIYVTNKPMLTIIVLCGTHIIIPKKKDDLYVFSMLSRKKENYTSVLCQFNMLLSKV